MVVVWPEDGKVTVETLAAGSKLYPEQIRAVSLPGSPAPIEWTRDENGLSVKLPGESPIPFACVLKISH